MEASLAIALGLIVAAVLSTISLALVYQSLREMSLVRDAGSGPHRRRLRGGSLEHRHNTRLLPYVLEPLLSGETGWGSGRSMAFSSQ